MQNQKDHESGWTQGIVNPKTGKRSYGGAARNIRLAQMGGAEALFDAGGVSAISQIAPLVNMLQGELAKSRTMNEEMARLLTQVNARNQK